MKKYYLLLSISAIAGSLFAQKDFDIKIDDITWKDAHVVITPADPDMKFYFSSMTIEKINEDPTMQGDIEKIPDFDYAWWEFVGGSNMNAAIQADLVSGAQDFRTMKADYTGMFRWNSQGVVYCYGVDATGEMCTPFYYKTINTLGPTAVDMTFDVNIEEMMQTSVKATITPSMDEPYFVSIERPAFINYYENDADMQYKLLQSYTEDYVFTGSLRTRESVFPLKSKDQDYNFVIFGFNNGPTTPITIVPFRTLKGGKSSLYRFEYYFLNEAGDGVDETCMAPIEGEEGAYTYIVKDGTEVAETWSSLTGYPISENEEYHLKYADNAYEVVYEISASKTALNGYYGEMVVDVYDYPFIKTIIFVDDTYSATGVSKTNIQTRQDKKYDLSGRPTQKHKGFVISNGRTCLQ